MIGLLLSFLICLLSKVCKKGVVGLVWFGCLLLID